MSIEVDLSIAQIGDLLSAGPMDELFQRKLTGQQVRSELFEIVRQHKS